MGTGTPRARQNDLVIQDAANELVVYDTKTDKAYVLNPTAAAVWRIISGMMFVMGIIADVVQIKLYQTLGCGFLQDRGAQIWREKFWQDRKNFKFHRCPNSNRNNRYSIFLKEARYRVIGRLCT